MWGGITLESTRFTNEISGIYRLLPKKKCQQGKRLPKKKSMLLHGGANFSDALRTTPSTKAWDKTTKV